MSAFILNNYHFDALLSYAKYKEVYLYSDSFKGSLRDAEDEVMSKIGQILIDENYRSVNSRYKDNQKPEIYKFKEIYMRIFKPIEIIKGCDCYDYQSCDTDDYNKTEAKDIVSRIKSNAIRNLSDYKNLDSWEITEPEKDPNQGETYIIGAKGMKKINR